MEELPKQHPFSCSLDVGRTDRLASESLSISGGNASVINARPGTTAEVGLGQIPQLFETREQFPHSLAQAHEWPFRFFPIITKLLYSAFKTPLSSCSFFYLLSFLFFEISIPVILAALVQVQSWNLIYIAADCRAQDRVWEQWVGGHAWGANKPFLLS